MKRLFFTATCPEASATRSKAAFASLLTAVLLFALPVLAQAQFTFTTNADNTLTITGYSGPGGAVTVPDEINGFPVTCIGDYAFYHCSGLTNVTIGTSVTSIGNYTFHNCIRLTSVTIPNSVTSIGASAFESTDLTSVTIPNSVTSIGQAAFSGCSDLTTITVDSLNPAYSSVSGVLFNKSQSLLIQCPGGKSGAYIIPNSVTSIGDSAFIWCSGLTSVTIGTSVTSIGQAVFSGCSGLTNVTIGTGVTNIGDWAFEFCSGLTGVTIPNSVTSIGVDAFNACSGLTSVTIGTSVTSIGDSAFEGCSGLTSVTIPNSVASIGGGAFSFCSGLTSVTIPNSVASIGDLAFSFCSGLTSVTIGTSVTSVGAYAFSGCSGLTSVTIPNSVTSVGEYAFDACSGLTSVTIPNSVTSIGASAFESCSGLTSVSIGTSVTYIGQAAFSGCSNLTSAYFQGNAPAFFGNQVIGNAKSGFTIYYPANATGWTTPMWHGYPAFPYAVSQPPQIQTKDGSFGLGKSGFGFNLADASNTVVVVESCTNLADRIWNPLQTNTFTGGSLYFSDPQWTNYPSRFYRLRWQ